MKKVVDQNFVGWDNEMMIVEYIWWVSEWDRERQIVCVCCVLAWIRLLLFWHYKIYLVKWWRCWRYVSIYKQTNKQNTQNISGAILLELTLSLASFCSLCFFFQALADKRWFVVKFFIFFSHFKETHRDE